MVFNDIGHHILDVKTGSTYLLGDEAGGRHARCGVYLQEVQLVAFGDDIVDADDAVTTEDVVEQ